MRTFTFGFDHKHPITGESLARHYIQVPGDADESRAIMLAVFGTNWAMQYESPSKLKHLDRMTELKWDDALRERAKCALDEIGTSSGRTPFDVDDELLTAAVKAVATNPEIDAYFDLQKQLPEVTTITGEPVTEYSLKMLNTMQVLPTDTEVEKVYPMAKHLRHSMKYGGQVYRRRLLIIEDWTPVTEEEVNELCKPYDEHEADLAPKDIKLP